MLSYQDLKGILTQTFIRVYQESIPAPSFLKTFFPVKTYPTATVMLEISRGSEKVAADIVRGSRGNRNTFSRWSAKEYMPPMYKEFFDATQLDHYDRVLGQLQDGNPATVAVFAREIAGKYIELRKKIERAKELQAAQVFETGIVQLTNGDDIDYKRKATSMVDLAGSGGYWSTASTNIEAQLIASAEFIRQEGKNGVPEFNLVMPGTAWTFFKKSDFFKDIANFNQVSLVDIRMPQTTSFGAGYHGRINAGAYIFNVWTYDEVYENTSDVITRYWPATKAFVMPVSGYDFELSHGAVPAIMKVGGQTLIGRTAAEYYQWDSPDVNEMSHYYYIASAPVALPVSIDMIYTMQVLDSNPEIG